MRAFQIGSEEPRNCVGSRCANSDNLEDAINECREFSRSRRIKSAWLRKVTDGKLGPVIVTFVKGQIV